MTSRKRTNKQLQKLTLTSVFAALIIVMTFTPLGYLQYGGVSITFLSIPVAVGAIFCGPATGTVLGAVFGLTSFAQCFGTDVFGKTLLTINPFYTAIMCLAPRILVGLFSGLVYKFLSKKISNTFATYSITSFSAAFLNTVLFLGSLFLFFRNTDYITTTFGSGAFAIISSIISLNGIIEWIASLVIGTAVSKAVSRVIKK